jgi:DNA-directed RNA polymerase
MTLLTQQEVEERMYAGGIRRMQERMADAEASGNAQRMPYAATILRDFVIPLAEAIGTDLDEKKIGRRAAHVALLSPLDPYAVAYLAVRTVLTQLMSDDIPHHRSLATTVGRMVHSELVLAQIEHLAPELYHTLRADFGRRLSKNVRHRMTVFKMQAKEHGVNIDEWGPGSRDQVGLYLLDSLARLGMIDIDAPPMVDGKKVAGKRHTMSVRLVPDVMETINNIKDFVAINSPVYGPCVEPPRDWTTFFDGGFHTADMRRTHRFMVKASSVAREKLMHTDMPTVFAAVNALQRTAWAVNGKVLDTVLELAKTTTVGEVISTYGEDKPPPPAFLATTEKADLTEEQQAEFKKWKRTMAEWYTQRKIAGAKYGRFYSATRAATMFRDYPALHFVYFADSRGRLYPLTYGVNPQGSDLQKALLHFALGKRLSTPEAVRWFLIHGANKWGFDKATLDDRAAWHKDKHQQIMYMASDPINHNEWQKADSPLQFLAWCFEYAEWQIDPEGFESRIPISMDGSCNGLQNFSAMLRDEVGGRATNLTDNAVMEDIYRRVAEAATAILQGQEPTELRSKWLAFGISRSMVKRSVMTTPYGVTKRSAIRYVIDDFLRKEPSPFTPQEFYEAAATLMEAVWPAIGKVVVKSREAMDWLKACAKAIIKERGEDTEGVITWVTPSGFVATQSYYELQEHRIATRIHGTTKIKVVTEKEDADGSRHATGLAPNFVHSMDAGHLHLTTAAAARCGIDALAMIHDDYGTHAADAQKLYELIREEFVRMYTNHDPIEDFVTLYPECPPPPSKGTLDLTEVLRSQYFFS